MIEFRKSTLPPVTDIEMAKIYDIIKTPHKLGPVMKWENHLTDSPTIFKKDGIFHMYFIAISKDCNVSGYETHLAKSKDLIHWEYVGPVFKRNPENHWDSNQCAGYGAFFDIDFGGTNELTKVNDSYYISYLGGNSDGDEPDPLYMGLAKCSNPTNPDGFTRFPEPILRPDDCDVRPFENKTLYKSFLFEDKLQVTGYKYVNAYNVKALDDRERIFLAVSDDGEHWERYGNRAVIDLITDYPTGLICGDPQIVLIDDIYVMFFFRYEQDKPAYNTFACSRDLISWNIWEGKPLIKSEFEWEDVHAHKTWFLRENGKNYHYYCAVNSKNECFIALAVSEI